MMIKVGDLIVYKGYQEETDVILFVLLKFGNRYELDTSCVRGDLYDIQEHLLLKNLGLYASEVIKVISNDD